MESESRHRCLLYQGPPSRQLPALAAVIQGRLQEGYRCLYLNSPDMVSGIRSALGARGVSVVEEVIKTSLTLSSESNLSPDGDFDPGLMLDKLEYALDRALAEGFKGLWASGDMAWEFGNKENLAKLLEYEWLLEDLLRRREELCGICQYHQDTLPAEFMRQGLLSHQTLFINETLSCFNPHQAQSKHLAEQAALSPELDEAIAKFYRMQNSD